MDLVRVDVEEGCAGGEGRRDALDPGGVSPLGEVRDGEEHPKLRRAARLP